MFFKEIVIKNKLNNSWKLLYEESKLTISSITVDKDIKIFTIGSCFAENIKKEIERKNFCESFPKYNKINFDNSSAMVDSITFGSNHLNHYSPNSILQELKRSYDDDQSFQPIKVSGFSIKNGRKVKSENITCFQDPYRREIFANSIEECNEISKKINDCVRQGLIESNVFVITLGLIEIFRDKKNSKIYNQIPNYLDFNTYNVDTLEFFKLTYPEVLKSLEEIIYFIKRLNKKNKIIFSVSPVPLSKTFTQNDVFTANIYSKSTLRAAVENVINQSEGIFYFPSYEIAINSGSKFYQERDLRHAKDEYVEAIIKSFIASLNYGDV